MRPSSTGDHNTPKVNTSSATVPLSVYRELAAELQAKEAILNSLNTQNQQLAVQNQQLRQEIAKAVQSVLHLSQVADAAKSQLSAKDRITGFASQPIRPKAAPRSTNRRPHLPVSTQKVAVRNLPVRKNRLAPGKLFTEQQVSPYRRRPQAENTPEINGWWLMLIIVLTMLTAFSAGYLVVRPLVQRH